MKTNDKFNKVIIPSKTYSKDTSSKFLFVRHGRSTYNESSEKGKTLDLLLNTEEIDTHLSPLGIEQAKKAQADVNKLNITEVYVSPLYRALETCKYILETHPNIDNIIVKIHPLVSENVCEIDDYVNNIQKSKKDFNMNGKVKFDWSIFDEYYPNDNKKYQDLFFLDKIDKLPDEIQAYIIDKIYKSYDEGEKSCNESLKELAQIAIDQKLDRLESIKYTFERAKKFKEFLKNTYKNDNNPDKKVLVVTHSNFSRTATSIQAYTMKTIDTFPEDTYFMANCEIISIYP